MDRLLLWEIFAGGDVTSIMKYEGIAFPVMITGVIPCLRFNDKCLLSRKDMGAKDIGSALLGPWGFGKEV